MESLTKKSTTESGSTMPFPKLSHLSETLIGSEIVKMNSDIREKMRAGEKIFNYTIGDFDPNIFSIPAELEEEIIYAYRKHFTNYPLGEGELELRESISRFISDREGLSYSPGEILIAGGGRPLIYTLYRAIADKGEKIIYSVPSWNNNHYVHFVDGEHCALETTAENNFMPLANDIRPHLKGAVLLALCSPLNPTGTTFSKSQLEEICDMVIEENNHRHADEKKLYIMYDQMYWQLCYDKTEHYNPVSLRPELRPYTIFVDGISKCFAATGVRVGWTMGPEIIVSKMKAILSHIGAWSPLPEQKATAKYLLQKGSVDQYLKILKSGLLERLQKIYQGFQQMKNDGYSVDAIAPQAAIYLTVKIDYAGKKTEDGRLLEKQSDVTAYLLNEAKLALVPFSSFGASKASPWYRLSVGTVRIEELHEMFGKLKAALVKL